MNSNLSAQIEALLFHHGEPIDLARLADICNAEPEAVRQAVSDLKTHLNNRGLTVVQHESAVQLRTDPDVSDCITRFRKSEVDTNLTDAQSEALAVIAYLSPATKPDIDFIRGVNSRTVLRNLQTRGLIQKTKENKKGVYKMTADALAHLGVTKPEDLPEYETTRNKLTEFVAAAQEDRSNNKDE